jgi:transposase
VRVLVQPMLVCRACEQAGHDNVAERAVRPLAVGRKNWLFIGGDAGLPTASVMMSLCASAKRHGLNPWAYLTDVLTRMSAKPTGLTPLLPDA